MALTDFKNRLKQVFAPVLGDGTRRPDGGTSCYRPMRKRMPGDVAGAQNDHYAQQPVQYVHTGFTGMNPPSEYGGGGTGYMPQPDYSQTSYARPAYSQQGFGQSAFSQGDVYAQQGAFGGYDAFNRPAAQPSGLFQGRPEPDERTAARPERGWFAGREQAAQPNNISYMPGVAPEGNAPVQHVEHIMTLTGLKSCYEAIECMKNGETLLVMLDAIANENESMRCQDMLAGAAFTLGCSVRMLQGGRLVLIAPEGVQVLPEQPSGARPEFPPVFMQAQQPAPQPIPQTAEPVQRERRSSPRAEEWNAALNGEMEQYNPYTGNMPVAAGAYGSFGGYGY
ncbi:MAG: cell division protein SepF [Clostridia bacterium]|nr:cell division protein SepF [Clostridia bacterium]